MATKFYLAEIPDDFPATNVKFENMTKPLSAIPAKMVDGKPITIVGYINAGQKKYKANDYGFVEFNDNGANFAQFKDANMDTRYSVREKVSGDILGYLPLETGELVGIVREKEKTYFSSDYRGDCRFRAARRPYHCRSVQNGEQAP